MRKAPGEGKAPYDLDSPPDVTFYTWGDLQSAVCSDPDCQACLQRRIERTPSVKLDYVWEGGIWMQDRILRCDYCTRRLRH